MFMRLVQVRVKEGFLPAVTRLYARVIAPALASTPGCRYAGLLQSVHHSDECISLTIWDSELDVEAYVRSGAFTSLLDQVRPFQAESSELRLQLTDDLKLEYRPVNGSPVIGAYPVAAGDVPEAGSPIRSRTLWVRAVSLKIKSGRLEEFKQLYTERAIPALRALKGCVYVFLVEKAESPNEVLSLSGWDSKEHADAYERSGLFDRLLDTQKDFLSDLYQMKREHQSSEVMVTSDDVSVDSYAVLVEESFEGVTVDKQKRP
jgi:quinol monooxygenase YgiN